MENNFQYISAAITDRGLSDKRPQNEDSYLEMNKSGLFAVADGVGGAQAGEVASSMAMEILGEAFVNMQTGGDAEEIMKAGIRKANSAIFQTSQDLPQLSSMATTIVALHLSGNIATIGHVGDSRLYRLDSSGNLLRETMDHSVVEEEVRAGRMTPEQALNHPSRNIISRALGAEPTVEIDLKTIMVEPNDTFLLCSDGITRHISDTEIRELLRSDIPPDEICEQMKFVCYERGAEDNLTAIVIRVSGEVSKTFTMADEPFELELDEPTVASARPSLVNSAISSGQLLNIDDADEIPTRNLQMTDEMRNHSQTQAENNEFLNLKEELAEENIVDAEKKYEIIPPIIDEKPVEIIEPIKTEEPPPVVNDFAENNVPTRYETREEREIFQSEPEKSDSGIFSKLLGGLLFLLIGAIIGAGLHYFWTQSNALPTQPAPQITQTQTDAIVYKSFEDNRRNVDRNPADFIKANGTPPQNANAEDYYLLGRAYLLNKQYAEARKAMIEAKNKLGQTPETNSKILATEIAMAMLIIDTPNIQKTFEQETSTGNPAANSNSVNANR